MKKATDELAYKAENSTGLGAKKIISISQSNAIRKSARDKEEMLNQLNTVISDFQKE